MEEVLWVIAIVALTLFFLGLLPTFGLLAAFFALLTWLGSAVLVGGMCGIVLYIIVSLFN
jgi:hypothetical protein